MSERRGNNNNSDSYVKRYSGGIEKEKERTSHVTGHMESNSSVAGSMVSISIQLL